MHPLSRQAAGRRLLATCQAAEPLRAGAAGEWRPGTRGVSAPRRAHQQGVWRWACGQTPAAAGGWPGSMVRGGGTRPVEKPFEIPILGESHLAQSDDGPCAVDGWRTQDAGRDRPDAGGLPQGGALAGSAAGGREALALRLALLQPYHVEQLTSTRAMRNVRRRRPPALPRRTGVCST